MNHTRYPEGLKYNDKCLVRDRRGGKTPRGIGDIKMRQRLEW